MTDTKTRNEAIETGQADGDQSQQLDFDVVLTSVGPNQTIIIKFVRELTGLDMKEAEALVDSVPKALKEHVPRPYAEELRQKFEDAGASVTLQ